MTWPCVGCGESVAVHSNPITGDERMALCYDCADIVDRMAKKMGGARCRNCGNSGISPWTGKPCGCPVGKALALTTEASQQSALAPSERTTDFVMSAVEAPPDTPVLFVRTSENMLSLARLDDVERAIREAREAAYDDVQEFVVLHTFDTSAGRRIDDYITEQLKALKAGDA